MNFAFGEPIVLHSRTVTGQNAYGNDIYTTTDTTVTGAFDPGGAVETVQGRDTVIARPAVYLTQSVGTTPVDQVTVRGTLWDVDGGADLWRNPFTGWTAGTVIHLKAVTG